MILIYLFKFPRDSNHMSSTTDARSIRKFLFFSSSSHYFCCIHFNFFAVQFFFPHENSMVYQSLPHNTITIFFFASSCINEKSIFIWIHFHIHRQFNPFGMTFGWKAMAHWIRTIADRKQVKRSDRKRERETRNWRELVESVWMRWIL